MSSSYPTAPYSSWQIGHPYSAPGLLLPRNYTLPPDNPTVPAIHDVDSQRQKSNRPGLFPNYSDAVRFAPSTMIVTSLEANPIEESCDKVLGRALLPLALITPRKHTLY